jgi:hypothetical protein
MKGRSVSTLVLLFWLGWAGTAIGATCPGTVVSLNLTSPSSSGTYSTPLHFQATASSSAGAAITGYAVYTNQWSDIPFAEGEPMYLSSIATLNAWVILPLTTTGGSLAQSVFVRAWDADGNCGDSSTLSITTSGAAIPTTFPSNDEAWDNRQDDQENSDQGNDPGWWSCGTTACAGGANAGTTTIAFGQTPERDSDGSIEFSLAGPKNSNGLFYYKVPPLGGQDTMQNFVWDFYFYLSADTSTDGQAIEFDLFQAKDGYKYMMGTQCNYHPSGGGAAIWNTWDQSYNSGAGRWVPAVPNTQTESDPAPTNAVPCSFSTGAWHHAQFYLQRTYPDSEYPQGRILYGTVAIDGAAKQWDISAPAYASSWGDVLGFQHQLDIDSVPTGDVTLQEWVDPENLTAWPQD